MSQLSNKQHNLLLIIKDAYSTHTQINFNTLDDFLHHIAPLANIHQITLDSLSHTSLVKIVHYINTLIGRQSDFIKINSHYKLQFEGTDFNICTQTATNMKLIIFQNLLVLDWDTHDLDSIVSVLSQHPYTFWIYKTYNGFHGYCMSKQLYFKDKESIKLMKTLNCDKVYIAFSKVIGYAVRLGPKKNRQEPFIEKFVCSVNNYPIIPRLQQLIQIKNLLIQNPPSD